MKRDDAIKRLASGERLEGSRNFGLCSQFKYRLSDNSCINRSMAYKLEKDGLIVEEPNPSIWRRILVPTPALLAYAKEKGFIE